MKKRTLMSDVNAETALPRSATDNPSPAESVPANASSRRKFLGTVGSAIQRYFPRRAFQFKITVKAHPNFRNIALANLAHTMICLAVRFQGFSI